MDAKADLSLRWAHSHFVGFVMRWLIRIDLIQSKFQYVLAAVYAFPIYRLIILPSLMYGPIRQAAQRMGIWSSWIRRLISSYQVRKNVGLSKEIVLKLIGLREMRYLGGTILFRVIENLYRSWDMEY